MSAGLGDGSTLVGLSVGKPAQRSSSVPSWVHITMDDAGATDDATTVGTPAGQVAAPTIERSRVSRHSRLHRAGWDLGEGQAGRAKRTLLLPCSAASMGEQADQAVVLAVAGAATTG